MAGVYSGCWFLCDSTYPELGPPSILSHLFRSRNETKIGDYICYLQEGNVPFSILPCSELISNISTLSISLSVFEIDHQANVPALNRTSASPFGRFDSDKLSEIWAIRKSVDRKLHLAVKN